MTRKVSAEFDLVHQQTQNQRYGSSHIGATAKDISNVVTDAASGVVDIFHGIDKAVADTWNNFWKDGKADGIGSNLSFFFQAEDGIRDGRVTGVQTCALPILRGRADRKNARRRTKLRHQRAASSVRRVAPPVS